MPPPKHNNNIKSAFESLIEKIKQKKIQKTKNNSYHDKHDSSILYHSKKSTSISLHLSTTLPRKPSSETPQPCLL